MMKRISAFLLSLFVLLVIPVFAKSLDACFLANDSCQAYQSFRKKTNPEGLKLEQRRFYQIVEEGNKNKAFRVRIKGERRSLRWVSGRCGEVSPSCKMNSKVSKYKSKGQSEYLLALSWQPSFCETHASKKECRTQTTNRYDATHLSLHGLWSQPRSNAYCGVSEIDKGIDRNKRWHLLAPVKLSQKTATALAFIMPGTASNLLRHEWIKHGTCYGTNADTYYSDAVNLTQQINQSIVGKLFTRGVGKRVSLKESLIKSIKFCWLTRHQILGVVFENGCSLSKNHNNGVDAL